MNSCDTAPRKTPVSLEAKAKEANEAQSRGLTQVLTSIRRHKRSPETCCRSGKEHENHCKSLKIPFGDDFLL